MKKTISWIHPSYRDLVISELATNSVARTRFLQGMSIRGIKLAISDTGGPRGERSLPFLTDSASWMLFRTRCFELASSANKYETGELFTVLGDAVMQARNPDVKNKIVEIISGVCTTISATWNRNKVDIDSYELSMFVQISSHTKPLVSMPDLDHSWNEKLHEVKDLFKSFDNDELPVEFYAAEEWIDFIDIIRISEPRFLIQVDFPNLFLEHFQHIASIIDYELDDYVDEESSDELQDKIDRVETMEKTLKVILSFQVYKLRFLIGIKNRVSELLEDLNQKVGLHDKEDRIEKDFEDSILDKGDSLDIEELFNDL